jgi:hypothetical protein
LSSFHFKNENRISKLRFSGKYKAYMTLKMQIVKE